MSNPLLKLIYDNAKAYYFGEKSSEDIWNDLKDDCKLSKRSLFGWYIPLFKYLYEGITLKGNTSIESKDYFITRITNDFGEKRLEKCLESYKGSIEYYESNGITKKGDKEVYEKHLQIFLELNNSADESTLENDETPNSETEGHRIKVYVNRYERNRRARELCIKQKGSKCAVCGFDFEQFYGEIGRDFIHVHHVVPLSEIGKNYIIDIEKDLEPVCPNCHAMLHKGTSSKQYLTIEDLKKEINKNKI